MNPMLEGNRSKIIPLVQDTAEWVDVIASVVGIPGLGIVAKLIAKAPLQDVANLLKRPRNETRKIDEAQGVSPTEGEVVEVPAEVEVAEVPTTTPDTQVQVGLTQVDISQVLSEYSKAQSNLGPFIAALDQAITGVNDQLRKFIIETSTSSIRYAGVYGLWPAFALEWKVRRHLHNMLGNSAVLQKIPSIRALVETEIAQATINYIVTEADEGKGTRMALTATENKLNAAQREHVTILAGSKDFVFDGLEGSCPGYAIGYVSVAETLKDPEAASQSHRLAAQLGMLSQVGLEELKCGWQRNLEAVELPSNRRQQRGLVINPFLSTLEYLLLQIEDKTLLGTLREDVEAIYLAPDANARLSGELSKLGLAYARYEESTFVDIAENLFDPFVDCDSINLAASPLGQRVCRVTDVLRQARGWD